MNPYYILKANYSLELGGVSSSKFDDFNAMRDTSFFLKYGLINTKQNILSQVKEFIKNNNLNYPLILKPNNGRTGMGIVKVTSENHLKKLIPFLKEPLIVQEFSNENEFGVFFYRLDGKPHIFSINSKELPYVIGDGKKNVKELVNNHFHLKHYIQYFKKSLNVVPKKGEKFILLYIGNHSKGCVFRNVAKLKSKVLTNKLNQIACNGFNYGRFDVMAKDEKSLSKGDFKIIEVNGVHSLSTSYLDPTHNVFDALSILNKQTSILVKVAYENRNKEMLLPSFRNFMKAMSQREKSISSLENSIRIQG